MAITRPTLPPKAGYVEVEVDGKRTYRNVATGVLIEDEVSSPTTDTEAILIETVIDQEIRIAELELALL